MCVCFFFFCSTIDCWFSRFTPLLFVYAKSLKCANLQKKKKKLLYNKSTAVHQNIFDRLTSRPTNTHINHVKTKGKLRFYFSFEITYTHTFSYAHIFTFRTSLFGVLISLILCWHTNFCIA